MEDKSNTPAPEVNGAEEGSVAAQLEGTPPEKPADQTPQTVPLNVYLDLKDDVKELKSEIKRLSSSGNSSSATQVVQGVAELAAKYPDVNVDFIQDLVEASTKKAQEAVESKYSPIIERQEADKKQEQFERAFGSAKQKVISDNPDLPADINWEAVKALALTPGYIKKPLADVVSELYGGVINKGRATTENDMRSGADRVSDIVDVTNLSAEQYRAVMADPKSRKAYFDRLDNLPGR